tara:strand:+ start:328 stop:888 length:561 start_codon:yes stop_codon:yes gene_type:complete
MKKKLLSEAQVRRFMGLAGINPLNEMAYMSEEDLEEGQRSMKKDDEMHEMRASAKRDELMEEEEDEMGDDQMADVEIDEKDLADVAEALEVINTKLAPLLDQAEGEGDMEMGGDMDLPDEEDEGPEEMPMDDEDEEKDPIDEELMEVEMELTEDEIVNEVARRVAKRIVEAKRAHKKMNEALGRKR